MLELRTRCPKNDHYSVRLYDNGERTTCHTKGAGWDLEADVLGQYITKYRRDLQPLLKKLNPDDYYGLERATDSQSQEEIMAVNGRKGIQTIEKILSAIGLELVFSKRKGNSAWYVIG